MEVTDEARERVTHALAAATQEGETVEQSAGRLARRGRRARGVIWRAMGRGRESLLVAQVDDLRRTDFYGPGGSDSERVNKKSYRPTPLYATVILRWPDRSARSQTPRRTTKRARGPW